MSYQVIARKYRPQRFEEVVGQDHVTRTLGNAIAQNRIAHAYLFVGPRGTGKTTLARIFAKCLNSTDGPRVDFADDDDRCREIAEGRCLDVMEIDGASNRGIEEIRELRDTVRYAPASCRFKIYIIDEVHMLTKEAFNALLKTLEEPPEHVKFMFATTEPEKVLPTILSRCQRFDLRRIPARLIVGHLATIAEQEGVQIDEPALLAIARGADGGMRDAESTLDQLISFCGNRIEEADVLSMFGLAARAQILALCDSILAGDVNRTLTELHDLSRNGKDLTRLLGDLLSHFRNLLILAVSHGNSSLLEASEAEMEDLSRQANLTGPENLTRIMDVLTDCERRLKDTTAKKILMEVSLLKAIDARDAMPINRVLDQLRRLRDDNNLVSIPAGPAPSSAASAAPAPAPERREPGRPTPINTKPAPGERKTERKVSRTPAAAAEPEPKPTPKPNSEPEREPEPSAASPETRVPDVSTPPRGDSLVELWEHLVEAAGRASPFTKSYLIEAHPVSLNKGVLTIGFDPEFAEHLELVDNSKNRTLLQTKLEEAGHPDVRVRFVKADAPADPKQRTARPKTPPDPGATGTDAAAATRKPGRRREKEAEQPSGPVKLDMEEFKDDPLIKKALEIFKGQIVEVRG